MMLFMTAPKDTLSSDPVVAELFSAWQACEQRLDQHKQVVRAAVVAYAKGTGPDPTRLMADLADMREDCKDVCASLVRSIQLARTKQ